LIKSIESESKANDNTKKENQNFFVFYFIQSLLLNLLE